MGWWSSVPAAVGSLSVERIRCVPGLVVDTRANQRLVVGGYDVDAEVLEVDRVEVL